MNNFASKSIEWPAWVLLPVVIGYLTMTRTFAYLGIAPIYVGEATLGLLLFFRPGMILGTWFNAQWRAGPYSRLADLAAIFVLYGLLQCVRGLSHGYPMVALQNFAFNFYIAFLFAGMWLGQRHPDLLPKTIWYLAWANGIYGIIYLAALGSTVSLYEIESGAVQPYGQPAGSAIAILGLLAFERSPRRMILPLLLNGCVMLGMQMRAEWLSFAAALIAMSYLTGRLSRLFGAGALVGGLLLVGLIADFEIPAPTGRGGGTISSREIVGRAISAVDEQAAYSLTPNATAYSGTVDWRTRWWQSLIRIAHADTVSAFFGKGYGYPIWEHNEVEQGIVSTPHNIFIFVLIYTGWLGVMLFYALQFCLARVLWLAYRTSGQPFGFCLWVMVFVWAHFDNKLEAPFGAIPFYVLVGMALTSAMVAMHDSKSSTRWSVASV